MRQRQRGPWRRRERVRERWRRRERNREIEDVRPRNKSKVYQRYFVKSIFKWECLQGLDKNLIRD